jgi:fluoride ion exporter CrcB/FEX
MLKYQGEGMKGLALAVGAFMGALFRFALGEWIPVLSDRFPLGTMLENHHFIEAFVYVVSSVLGGIVLVGVGQSIAEFQIRGSRSKGA